MSGTHRDLLFGSKSRCFASKNHRWGLGPIETSHSCAKVAVLQAQNNREGLEPIKSFYSCAKHAVMCAKNHKWYLGPIQTYTSGHKVAVLHEKSTDEGWNPYRLVILVQVTLLCKHKRQVMSGTHRDLLFRSISRCFASKNHTWGLGPMETSYSDARHAILHAEIHTWGLGPTETCYSGPEVAVLPAKTTGGVYSPAETSNSSPKVAVLLTQKHSWRLEPI